MRLDNYLVLNGYFESRNKAQYEIKNENVLVNNKTITKASFDVSDNDSIEILSDATLKYVSKGGLKLERALDYFMIEPSNLSCLDIGSSTGGFTDCLLKRGAKEVYAVDTGTNQLHESLRSNEKIHLYENINFLKMDLDILKDIKLITIDVSFTKVEPILERVIKSFKDVTVVFLIKPQFELGQVYLKGGVVREESLRNKVKTQILDFIKAYGIKTNEIIDSPILGGSGNKEYLTYIKV